MDIKLRKAFQEWLPDRYGHMPGIVIMAESKDEAIEIYKQHCRENDNEYRITMLEKGSITFDQIGVLTRTDS